MRPSGSNADEWHLFLCERLDNRATHPDGLTYVAVQIAEALDAKGTMERELRRLRGLIEMEAGVPWSDGFITDNLKKIDAAITQEINAPMDKQVCKKCRSSYVEDENDDGYCTDLCYECFEEGVEEAEIRRRETE